MPPGKVRIIGGRWRGRRLTLARNPELRPTPDRVRETLFNWLAPFIDGAQCLDCFAGSGALSFEALSRGAAGAVMIERERDLVRALEKHAEMLGAGNAEIVWANALSWLPGDTRRFDIVFLDPPFDEPERAAACLQLLNRGHLAPRGLVYVESGAGLTVPEELYRVRKESRAGQVRFMLLEAVAGTGDEKQGDLSGDV